MASPLSPTQTRRPLPRWKPAPLVLVSMLLPPVLLAAVCLYPRGWPLALAMFLANQLVLTALGMWPRSRLLGPNLLRLPAAAEARREIAITFDDGPDAEVTPQVLDCLDRHHARASFFCCAGRAEADPELVREILRRGHSVENHSWRHSNAFALYGWWRLKRELEASQAILARLTGRRPEFFRAPMGLRNPLLDPLLARSDLRLTSWTRRGYDSVRRDGDGVLRRLQRGLAAGDILLLHDGHAARTGDGTPVVLVVLPRLLAQCAANGLRPVSLPMAFSG